MAFRVEYIEQTTSTNDEARSSRFGHGGVVVAERQTAGRGQRGNKWLSEQGKNLMFSVVLSPSFLPVASQFLLSEAVALAVTDALREYGIAAQVKWPNDIYAGERKIAGILIENDIKGSVMWRSIAGIGLNVNQTEFDPSLPNPTSMALCVGREYDRREVLGRILHALEIRYDALAAGDAHVIETAYHSRLYRIGQQHNFSLPDGSRFSGTIQRVEQDGQIVILTTNGTTKSFYFKEVTFEG